MKFYQILAFLIVAVLFLAGCTTIELEKQDEANSEFNYEDGIFKISGRNDDLTSFVAKEQNADIRDLASFSISLYQHELLPKLRDGKKLTRAELQLLEFCMIAQIYAIDAYTLVGLQDILENTNLPIPIENHRKPAFLDTQKTDIKNFYDQMQEVCHSMQVNFGKSNSILRKNISEWSAYFQPLDKNALASDLVWIQRDGVQKIDDFQWRQLWLYLPIVYIIAKPLGKEGEFFETKALRPYKKYTDDNNPKEVARQWIMLNNAMSYPIKELESMYDDLGEYIKIIEDQRYKTDIVEFQLSKANDMNSAIEHNAFVFNDLPFSVFCKHAYISIQDCKGIVDDVTRMEDVASQFFVRTNRSKMLFQLRSEYSKNLFRQLYVLLKEELGETRFQNLKNVFNIPSDDAIEE